MKTEWDVYVTNRFIKDYRELPKMIKDKVNKEVEALRRDLYVGRPLKGTPYWENSNRRL